MGSRMQQSSGKNKMMFANQQIGEVEEEDDDNKPIEAEPSEQEPAEDVIELTEE
jgi:hypothetical protein